MSMERRLVAARTRHPDYAALACKARTERSQALLVLLSALGRGLVTLVAARFTAPTTRFREQ